MPGKARKPDVVKPDVPYEDFPLFAHKGSRQWAKSILGKRYYFGSWNNGWKAALDKYNTEKDFLFLGQSPPVQYTTLGEVLDAYMSDKQTALQLGTLKQRTFNEYEETCDTIAATLGKDRRFDGITRDELTRLKVKLCHTDKGKLRSVQRQETILSMARQPFLYASEELDLPIQYRKALKGPSAKDIRIAKSENGEQMFDPDEINALIGAARPQIKAMILLGINCGFGNLDCGLLTLDKLDLVNGWHRFPRPKTGAARRCKLWADTIKAIKAAIKERPDPKKPEHQNLVFVTRCGDCWCDGTSGDDAVGDEFTKVAKELKIHVKFTKTFYSLRRTFETVGTNANRQSALDLAMGHVPKSHDMAAVYRQKIYDKPLIELTTYVRRWLRGTVSLV